MVLRMAAAMERGKTFYFKERVPSDLVERLWGRKVFIPVDGTPRTVTLGEFAQVSLRTKEAKVAKERYREASAAVQEMWSRYRQEAATGPVRLTGKQIEGIAGAYYREIIEAYSDDPGPPGEAWSLGLDAARDLTKAGRERAYGEDADRLLQAVGLVVDQDSRTRLLEALNRANIDAHLCLSRRAEGGFSPDPAAARFPALPKLASADALPSEGGAVTLSELFELWKADHLHEGGPAKTVKDFRQKLDSLIAFVGHEEAGRITPREIAAWTEHLRHEEGLSSRTVNDKYLAAVKRVFTVGKRKFRISDNPAADVAVEVKKAVRSRSPGFTEEEAKTILSAAIRAPQELGRRSEHVRRAIR